MAYAMLARPEHNKKPPLLSRADGTWMYLQMRSHVLDGDWDYENDYRIGGGRYKSGQPKWEVWLGRTKLGKPGNPWTMGTGWLLAPFFVVGHGLALLANALGAKVPTNGVSLVDQYTTYLGTVVYAFWGLVIIFGMARRRFGSTPALVGCVGVLLSSTLFFYSTYVPSFSHGVAFFCAACLLWCWDRLLRPADEDAAPPAWWRWLVFGALTGLAALVRPQLAVFALPAAGWWFAWAWRCRRRVPELARLAGGGVLSAAAALLVFLPQMLYWRYVFGKWLTVPQGDWFMQWDNSLMWETLFSARGGLLVVTPLMWFAVLGLVLLARRDRTMAAMGVGLVLITAFINGAAWDFWSGWGYGARRFTCAVTVLMIGGAGLVAVVQDWARRRPAVLGWVAAALLVAPMVLFSQWHMGQTVKRYDLSTGLPDRDMTFYTSHFFKDTQREVGNPLTWPHAVWLRLRYGLPLGHYSRLITDYPLPNPAPWMRDRGPRMRRAKLDLSSRRWSKLVLKGVRPVKLGRHKAWKVSRRCVVLLVPLRIRARYRLRVELLSESPATSPESVEPALEVHATDRKSVAGRAGSLRTHRRLRGLHGRWVDFQIPASMTRAGLNRLFLCVTAKAAARPHFRYIELHYVR